MKKIISGILAAALLVTGCALAAGAEDKMVTKADYTPEELDCANYDAGKYVTPFWQGNLVYNEAVFPITEPDDKTLPAYSLLYDASEIVCVRTYSGHSTKVYTEGTDYALEDGKLVILPGSKIPTVKYSYIHPTEDVYNEDYNVNDPSSPLSAPLYPAKDGSGYERWYENTTFPEKTLWVTYIHNDTWDYGIPGSAEDALPKTFAKLKAQEDIKIVFIGDSVTNGAQSSKALGMSPRAAAYPAMSMAALKTMYGYDGISYKQAGVGGDSTRNTLAAPNGALPTLPLNERVIDEKPDLVIVAYGMNDSSENRVGIPADEFKSNIAKIMDIIKEGCPDCEFLLVSSIYGNMVTFRPEMYEAHAQGLAELAEEREGVAFCDPQGFERTLFDAKKYIDIMADNMVHPNDFGMRIIAQTVLASLTPKDLDAFKAEVVADIAAKGESDGAKTRFGILANEVEGKLAEAENMLEIGNVIREAYAEAAYPMEVAGDVNGDGKLNVSDVTALLKYIAKWPDVAMSRICADVNRDGKINVSDVTTMLKAIANWPEVVLG